MPTAPEPRDLVPWALANNLDPSRVVAGSVRIVGDKIVYDVAVQDGDGSWRRVGHQKAPLLVSMDDFDEQEAKAAQSGA